MHFRWNRNMETHRGLFGKFTNLIRSHCTSNRGQPLASTTFGTSSSSFFSSHFPVLPHPEHPDVHFDRPISVIPDHTNILQACWGRSAHHHSQGTTTSLLWPPWRPTPPSSSADPTYRTTTSSTTPAPITYTHGHSEPDQLGAMDISDSSV